MLLPAWPLLAVWERDCFTPFLSLKTDKLSPGIQATREIPSLLLLLRRRPLTWRRLEIRPRGEFPRALVPWPSSCSVERARRRYLYQLVHRRAWCRPPVLANGGEGPKSCHEQRQPLVPALLLSSALRQGLVLELLAEHFCPAPVEKSSAIANRLRESLSFTSENCCGAEWSEPRQLHCALLCPSASLPLAVNEDQHKFPGYLFFVHSQCPSKFRRVR